MIDAVLVERSPKPKRWWRWPMPTPPRLAGTPGQTGKSTSSCYSGRADPGMAGSQRPYRAHRYAPRVMGGVILQLEDRDVHPWAP